MTLWQSSFAICSLLIFWSLFCPCLWNFVSHLKLAWPDDSEDLAALPLLSTDILSLLLWPSGPAVASASPTSQMAFLVSLLCLLLLLASHSSSGVGVFWPFSFFKQVS
jgi:hypothetical protein